MHAQKFFEKFTVERLVGLCYLGLQHGWFTKEGRSVAMLRPLTVKVQTASGGDEKTSMRAASEADRQARDRCQNTLHLSATILANSDIQFDSALAAWMTQPQQAWHSELCSSLRNLDFAVEVAVDFAIGGRSASIIEKVMTCFDDGAGLQRLGFDVDFCGKVWALRTVGDPPVFSQDLIWGGLARWPSNSARRRLTSCSCTAPLTLTGSRCFCRLTPMWLAPSCSA